MRARRPWGAVLFAGAVLAATAASCGSPDVPSSRPNVILISADTLRFDRLNVYGYRSRVTSPRLDRLAADGVVFELAITAAPWTTPAHMSLFTGLSPSAHGMVAPLSDVRAQRARGDVQRLPEARTTLAEALAAGGYRTAAFTGGGTMDPRIGFDQGFSAYRTSMFKMSDASMTEMLDWIRRRRAEPFFVFWHTFETHFPYLGSDFLPDVLPPQELTAARALLERITHQLTADQFSDPSVEGAVGALHAAGLLTRDVCEALYTGAVRSVDRWLGVLVDALRAEGLYDDTLIVFTSDHGEEFADHNPTVFYNGHGHSVYDEVVRVPLVMKLPSSKHAGARVRELVRLVDVYPTILDLLGLPAPTEPLDGASLAPYWEQRANGAARTALVEALAFSYELKALRTPQWKYIVGNDAATVAARGRQYLPEAPTAQWLYDVVHDPREAHSLLTPPVPDGVAEQAGAFYQALRRSVAPVLGATDRIQVDDSLRERLRALGYTDDRH